MASPEGMSVEKLTPTICLPCGTGTEVVLPVHQPCGLPPHTHLPIPAVGKAMSALHQLQPSEERALHLTWTVPQNSP